MQTAQGVASVPAPFPSETRVIYAGEHFFEPEL